MKAEGQYQNIETDRKKKHKSDLEDKWEKGTPVYYARFHQPVPPAIDKEPVSEFKLQSAQKKYLVEGLRWSWGDGLIFKAFGEIDFCPEANVQYVRFTI